jgi:glycine/D-amino acid oxidase-like deaminating enzyme
VFALSAWQRGRIAVVIDPEEATPNCSWTAAGLMNPISGPRLALGEDEESFWTAARAFYRHWEAEFGARCLEERPIFRLFTDAEQAAQWAKRTNDPRYAPWYEPLPVEWDPSRYRCAPGGGFVTKRCGRLDVAGFLDAARQWLRDRGAYRQGRVDPDQGAVWCLGFRSREQGPFQNVPVRPARGTIFTIRAPDLRETQIVHAGKWLVPIGEDLYRTGSTYEWEPLDVRPSEQGRAELTRFLNGFLRCDWELVQEDAGIRPMANRGRPFLGRHPDRPEQILFNGLGSRGSLLAPFYAGHLLDHLERDTPLDPRVDAGRFLLA